jgi:hypothetical protein
MKPTEPLNSQLSTSIGYACLFLFGSRCLILNAHLVKILIFCKILDLKITHLEKNFDQYSALISSIITQPWHSKARTIILLHKIRCISYEKNCQNFGQKCKWALWMRHQGNTLQFSEEGKFFAFSLVFYHVSNLVKRDQGKKSFQVNKNWGNK